MYATPGAIEYLDNIIASLGPVSPEPNALSDVDRFGSELFRIKYIHIYDEELREPQHISHHIELRIVYAPLQYSWVRCCFGRVIDPVFGPQSSTDKDKIIKILTEIRGRL